MSETKNCLSGKLPAILGWVGVGVVLAMWFGFPWWMKSQYPNVKLEPGTHGDMYGALNALFTALAFLLLGWTAWMQRLELKEQRKQLELTRNVFEAQKINSDAQLVLLSDESRRKMELYEAEISPIFMIRLENFMPDGFTIVLHNGGAPVFDLKIVHYQFVDLKWPQRIITKAGLTDDVVLDRRGQVTVHVSFADERLSQKREDGWEFTFGLKFKDLLQRTHQRELKIGINYPPETHIL